MCLNKIKPLIRKHRKYGYKLFREMTPGKLSFIYMGCATTRQPVEWLHESDFRTTAYRYDKQEDDNGKTYFMGFHCYTNLFRAFFTKFKFRNTVSHLVLWKVELRDIVAVGRQQGLVVVAKEIRLIKQIGK
jgi:hypothetical protein